MKKGIISCLIFFVLGPLYSKNFVDVGFKMGLNISNLESINTKINYVLNVPETIVYKDDTYNIYNMTGSFFFGMEIVEKV